MGSPRRGRDFSNINNLRKKKVSKQKRSTAPKEIENPSKSIDAYRDEQEKRRIAQLVEGNATEDTEIVFQSTIAFQSGVDTIQRIRLKHQLLPTETTEILPRFAGMDSEQVKSARVTLLNTKAAKGRFAKALKVELEKTKKSHRENKQSSLKGNAFEQQRKQTIQQKKLAIQQSSDRRQAETKLNPSQKSGSPASEEPVQNVETAHVEKNNVEPVTEKEIAVHDKPQNPEATPIRAQEVSKKESAEFVQDKQELQVGSEVEKRHLRMRKPSLIRRFIANIVRAFSRSKSKADSTATPPEQAALSKTSARSQPATIGAAPQPSQDNEVREHVKVEVEMEFPVTDQLDVEASTEAEAEAEQDEPELIDPLDEFKAQRPVYQRIFRNEFRKSKNPVLRMEQILMESEREFDKKDASTLIDYISTPWALMNEINYNPRLEFLRSMGGVSPTKLPLNEELLKTAIDAIGRQIETELLDMLFEILKTHVALSESEIVEIVEDFADAYPKKLPMIVLSHIIGRTPFFMTEWTTHASVGNYEAICTNNMYYMKEKFTQRQIEAASEVFSAFALECPALASTRYTLRRHEAGKVHEGQVERWVKTHLKDADYILEDDLKLCRKKQFGIHQLRPRKKFPHINTTPDILFAHPVRLEGHDTKILWIDAKNAMYDPAFTKEETMGALFGQMERYLKEYGPGLMVWGKPFSEEWPEHTEPAVMHTTLAEMN